MKFKDVTIDGLSGVRPPVRFTSDEVEKRLQPLYERLGLPAGRLELMTGIRARHFWGRKLQPSDCSAEAGRRLLEEFSVDLSSIDLLIHCGVCRDRLEPATAAYVHGLLGLPSHCGFLDVSNACLGFVNAMVLAAGLIQSGQVRRVLLVSGENGWPLLERTLERLNAGDLNRKQIKPFFANLTIGAGAAAMLLSHSMCSGSPLFTLESGVVRSDSAANQLCQGESVSGDGLEMVTEAEALLEAGVELARQAWADFSKESGWTDSVVDHYVCHQVGKTHQYRLFQKLQLDLKKDVTSFEEMGNVGSVSLPYTLWEGWSGGKIRGDSHVSLLGIGSGLSTVMLGIRAVE